MRQTFKISNWFTIITKHISYIIIIFITVFSVLQICYGKTNEEEIFVNINKVEQYLNIRYNDLNFPIILFIHGGPGSSLVNESKSFDSLLLKNFIIINWDQRNTGKTKIDNSNKFNLNILHEDTEEVIKFIMEKFNRKKIYLASHSWGSVLAFNYIIKLPDNISAYIGISPIIDQKKSTELTINDLTNWAKENNNIKALSELSKVNIPINDKKDLYFQQKWLFIKNGLNLEDEKKFKEKYYIWMDIWFDIWLQSVKKSIFEINKNYKCPIYFIEGNYDGYKSHNLVEEYYNYLDSPSKGLYWMEFSGHTIYNTEPIKLQEIIIEILNRTYSK